MNFLRRFGFGMVGSDTAEPDRLEEELKNILIEANNGEIITEERLESVRRKKIGAFLRSLNSPESIANQFTRYAFNNMELFDVVNALETITFNDVQKAVKELIDEERMSVFQILPS